MQHITPSSGGVARNQGKRAGGPRWEATRRTLSDLDGSGAGSRALYGPQTSQPINWSQRGSADFDVRRKSQSYSRSIKACITCHQAAEYLIPAGETPRTVAGEVALCLDCLEHFLKLLATSIQLPGESCEWEATLRCVENIHDGGHDFRRDLMQYRCQHRSCAAARELEEADYVEAHEEEVSA